jgi:hypothetical protein
MKARPTEYKGVRFRSKSEAVFARYLDLWLEADQGVSPRPNRRSGIVSRGGGGFEYEPITMVNGWHPDFMLWRTMLPSGDGSRFYSNIPKTEIEFIEYKPSRPTKTYCEEWLQKVGQWIDLSIENESEFHYWTGFAIFFGSPFSSAERGVIRFEKTFFYDFPIDWVDEYPSLMDYRFDLAMELV